MSMDKSLRAKSSLERHRNVLSRAERIEKLKELGRWTDENRALGLPKVAHRKASVGKKEKAPKAEAAPGTAPAVEGAAPAAAAGKAPAAGGKAPAAGGKAPAAGAAPAAGKKEGDKDRKKG